MKRWLRHIGAGIGFGLIAIFVLTILIYTIFLFKSDPQLATAYVALGTLMLALVTSLLVILTWWSVRQTEEITKHDRKERFLGEIIDWVIDVTKCGMEKRVIDVTDNDKATLSLFDDTGAVKLNFQAMRGRNKYISDIALTFGQDLQNAVEGLIKDLEVHIDLLELLQRVISGRTDIPEIPDVPEIRDIPNLPEKFAKIGRAAKIAGLHKSQLDEQANKVIEEAVKIKTEDIV